MSLLCYSLLPERWYHPHIETHGLRIESGLPGPTVGPCSLSGPIRVCWMRFSSRINMHA